MYEATMAGGGNTANVTVEDLVIDAVDKALTDSVLVGSDGEAVEPDTVEVRDVVEEADAVSLWS